MIQAFRATLLAGAFWGICFGADESNPWPPKDIQFVVGYCYDFIQDTRGDVPVFPDGSLNRGVIGSGTVRLSSAQQRRLIEIVTTSVDPDESMDCFFPRHAFVFYDSDRKPCGWVSVCVTCGNYRVSSESAPKNLSFEKLFDMIKKLQMPVIRDLDGRGEDYTELYRREQPSAERMNVLTWAQYQNLQMGRPIDWKRPDKKLSPEDSKEIDPFAPPPKEEGVE